MGEDDLPAIGDPELSFQHLGTAPDHLTGIGPDQMNTQDGPLLFVYKNLAQTVRTLVLCHKAAGVHHRQLFHFVRDILFLTFFFGLAHGSHLRHGVDDRRNGMVTHIIFLAKDGVDRNLCLTVGGVRQHVVTVYVTDGIHIRHVGPAHRIGNDAGPVCLYTNGFQTDIRTVGPAANGQQYLVCRNQLL